MILQMFFFLITCIFRYLSIYFMTPIFKILKCYIAPTYQHFLIVFITAYFGILALLSIHVTPNNKNIHTEYKF